MFKRTVLLMLTCILLMTGCSSQVANEAPVQTPEATESVAPTVAPTPEALVPDKGYTKITEMPELRVINKPMAEKVQPESTKELQVVYEGAVKIRSHLIASGNKLFFGDYDGKFYAFDTTTNQILWTYEAGTRIITKPVLEGDKILFNASNSLYCLNAKTGEELWKFTREVDAKVRGITGNSYDFREATVAFYEGAVYYPANDGSITAVDLESGKEVWRNVSEYPVPITSGLVVYKDRLYYSTLMGELHCLDLKTHKQVFRLTHNDPIHAPMLIADDRIYFAGRTCRAYAVNAITGEVLWMTQVPTRLSWYSGGVVMSGDELYFGTSDEFNVVVLDKNTGEYRKMFRTHYNVFTEMLDYQNQLIITDCEVRGKGYGTVQVFDMASENRKLWQVELEEGILSSPVIIGNKIYFGTEKGRICSVNLEQ